MLGAFVGLTPRSAAFSRSSAILIKAATAKHKTDSVTPARQRQTPTTKRHTATEQKNETGNDKPTDV